MNKIIFLSLLSAVLFCSCSKDITPSLGLNSNLKIENIKLQNYATSSDAILTGEVYFYFIRPNDSISGNMDTLKATSQFSIPTTSGYTQTLNFNTPDGSKFLNMDIYVDIEGGTATAVTIDKLYMDYDDKVYLDTAPLSFDGTGSNFRLPTQTVTY